MFPQYDDAYNELDKDIIKKLVLLEPQEREDFLKVTKTIFFDIMYRTYMASYIQGIIDTSIKIENSYEKGEPARPFLSEEIEKKALDYVYERRETITKLFES